MPPPRRSDLPNSESKCFDWKMSFVDIKPHSYRLSREGWLKVKCEWNAKDLNTARKGKCETIIMEANWPRGHTEVRSRKGKEPGPPIQVG